MRARNGRGRDVETNGSGPKRSNPALVWGVTIGTLVLVIGLYVWKSFG